MKKVIRLTEGDLHRIIENSVKRVINEIGDTPNGMAMLKAASNRAFNQGREDDSDAIDAYADKAYNANKGNYANAVANAKPSQDEGDWRRYQKYRQKNYQDAYNDDNIERDKNGKYSWNFNNRGMNYSQWLDKNG